MVNGNLLFGKTAETDDKGENATSIAIMNDDIIKFLSNIAHLESLLVPSAVRRIEIVRKTTKKLS